MRDNGMTAPRLYKGVAIFRNTEPGSRLRYSARHETAGMLSADTLAGIKTLIREAMESGNVV
jgi:hypothetical protein